MQSLSLADFLCVTHYFGLVWRRFENKVCKRGPSQMYTAGNNGCDGWANTDLEKCKSYCKNNKLPEKCTNLTLPPVCKYVVWQENAKWCHLAKACTMTSHGSIDVMVKPWDVEKGINSLFLYLASTANFYLIL